LRTHGVRVAIDDAGAGFASLRHTLAAASRHREGGHQPHPRIDGDRAKRALTSSLSRSLTEMGIAIVAEGIETAEEMDALVDLGVPFGQGFYLAEPAPL
jgi:EAL domain-containing protein (putative c-di-GMP-specific phosphodiesterase class I)